MVKSWSRLQKNNYLLVELLSFLPKNNKYIIIFLRTDLIANSYLLINPKIPLTIAVF
jgi:hypothetical protein